VFKSEKAGEEEKLQALYYDISRMAGLAFPGKSSIHREIEETEAFIEAIYDGSFKMRIRDKEPKELEQALRIALLAEANTAECVSVEAVETKVKDYKACSAHSAMSASKVEEAMIAGVNSEVKEKNGLDKRYEKMCEAMETLSKSLTAMSAKTSTSVSVPPQAHIPYLL